jgi:hypothetical protein
MPSREQLLPWMLRFVQDQQHAAGIQVLEEYAWDFRVLGGLIERVRRAASAYFLLEKRGYKAEGRALVRSALEHAVTAQWAYLTEDGVSRLQAKLLNSRADYAMGLRDPEDPEWERLIDGIRAQIPRTVDGQPVTSMPKLTGKGGVIPELDATGYLTRAYVVLSRAGHVTDQAVTDYFVDGDEGLAVATAPAETHDSDVFHTLATSCCLAAWVLARIEGDAKGVALATDQGLLWRLDTHLPSDRRRFPGENV